ncbi:hypothetical protein BJX99DRAFT_263434 [Aspergillus californicus]
MLFCLPFKNIFKRRSASRYVRIAVFTEVLTEKIDEKASENAPWPTPTRPCSGLGHPPHPSECDAMQDVVIRELREEGWTEDNLRLFSFCAWYEFPKAFSVPFSVEDDYEDDLMDVKFVEIMDVWRAVAASLADVGNDVRDGIAATALCRVWMRCSVKNLPGSLESISTGGF